MNDRPLQPGELPGHTASDFKRNGKGHSVACNKAGRKDLCPLCYRTVDVTHEAGQ